MKKKITLLLTLTLSALLLTSCEEIIKNLFSGALNSTESIDDTNEPRDVFATELPALDERNLWVFPHVSTFTNEIQVISATNNITTIVDNVHTLFNNGFKEDFNYHLPETSEATSVYVYHETNNTYSYVTERPEPKWLKELDHDQSIFRNLMANNISSNVYSLWDDYVEYYLELKTLQDQAAFVALHERYLVEYPGAEVTLSLTKQGDIFNFQAFVSWTEQNLLNELVLNHYLAVTAGKPGFVELNAEIKAGANVTREKIKIEFSYINDLPGYNGPLYV